MTQAVAALTFCSFASVAFAGTEVSHRRFRDEAARIEYSWIDNCTSKQLTVMAARTRLKEDGVTAAGGPSVSITYSTYRFCDLNNTEQTFWSGTATDATVQIDSNLRSARLIAASVTLQGSMFREWQQTDLGTTDVSVDITWSSDDPLDKYASTFVTRYAGYHEVNHLTGLYRVANATGTISDGANNWLPTAPESKFAHLYRLNQAESILIKD